MNGLTFIFYFQCFTVIAFALTDITGYIHIRQEVHLHFDHAVTLTGFATPTFDVKRETPRRITPRTRFLRRRKQLTDRCKQPGIGRRIRTRCPTNRALVDIHNLVQIVHPLNIQIRRWLLNRGTVQVAVRNTEQGIVDQRRFTGTGHPGDTGHHADRNMQIDFLQVVTTGTQQLQPFVTGGTTFCRDRNLLASGEIFTGH